jgi:hypothetical protein
MVSMIEAHPGVHFHGHLAQMIDETGQVIRKQRPYSHGSDSILFSGVKALKGKLRQEVRFKEPACNFYKKTAWEKVGGYDKNYRFLTDINFNCKLMQSFPSALWNSCLAEVRRHPASDGAILSSDLALKELDKFVLDLLQRIGHNASVYDVAAGRGWVIYRLFELFAQRVSRNPAEVLGLLVNNSKFLVTNPIAYIYAARLLRNKLFYNDVQQKISD